MNHQQDNKIPTLTNNFQLPTPLADERRGVRDLEGAGGCKKDMTKDETIRVAQQMVLSSFLEEVVSDPPTPHPCDARSCRLA